MKYKLFFLILLSFCALSGCSNEYTEKLSIKEAEEIVKEEYSNFNGSVDILESFENKDGYYIKWENKGNLHKGETQVYYDGKIKIIDGEIASEFSE